MTTAPLPANAGAMPSVNTGRTHALAKALDDYLRLTDPEHDRRRELEAYLGNPDYPDLEPGFTSLARFRFEAEQEVERLIALLDLLDGDTDFEPSLIDPNYAYNPHLDECEAVCEDEGAQCDDEGASWDDEPEPEDIGICDRMRQAPAAVSMGMQQ